MPATPQKSVPARNKSSGTGTTSRGRGKARDNKENIPKKSTGDRSRSSTCSRGGQEVQEVIYQCRELEKTAQIQKGTDCKDTSQNNLTVMMMALSQRLANRWKN